MTRAARRERVQAAKLRSFGETLTLSGSVPTAIVDEEIGFPTLREIGTRTQGTAFDANYQTHARVWLADSDASGLYKEDSATLRSVDYIIVDIGASQEGLTPVDLMRPGYELEADPDVGYHQRHLS